MKRISFAISIFLLLLLSMNGCNTIEGMGEDVEAVGEETQEALD